MKLEDKIMKAFDDGINDQKYLYQVKRDVSDIFKLHKYKKIEKKEPSEYTKSVYKFAQEYFKYDGCGEAIRCEHTELKKIHRHEFNNKGFVTKTITGYQCKECNHILYTQ